MDFNGIDPDLLREIVFASKFGGTILLAGVFLWLAGDKVAAIIRAVGSLFPWGRRG